MTVGQKDDALVGFEDVRGERGKGTLDQPGARVELPVEVEQEQVDVVDDEEVVARQLAHHERQERVLDLHGVYGVRRLQHLADADDAATMLLVQVAGQRALACATPAADDDEVLFLKQPLNHGNGFTLGRRKIVGCHLLSSKTEQSDSRAHAGAPDKMRAHGRMRPS